MQKNDNISTDIRSVLKKKLCDPVLLYTAAVMTAIMYHYTDTLYFLFGIAALAAGLAMFTVFDFMMKHKVLGTFAYIAMGAMIFWVSGMTIELGYRSYTERSIPFLLWFITPQAALDFNFWYTVTMFVLFMFFMASVIYYFTRVRYRVFMGFLIFAIPFAMYGKEAERMPIPFIILLAMGYLVLMIYFRELREDGTIVIKAKRETWKSVAIFTMAFAVIGAIVPKPKITADRTFIDTMISADRFTDRLMALLSAARDDSNGGQYRNVNSDVPLYYALADEELHLKTATFTEYRYGTDSWNSESPDRETIDTFRSLPADISKTGGLLSAILCAADIDSDFAKKYGLSGFSQKDIVLPEKKEMTIYSVFGPTQFVPVPSNAERLMSMNSDKDLILTKTGLVKGSGKFEKYAAFTFEYGSNTFLLNSKNKEMIDALSDSDYKELLSDAYDILDDEWRYWDYENDEIEEYLDILDAEKENVYDFYMLLDYGNDQRIKELADEITKGLSSDYDKAKAIELYFVRNGFVYDLDYVKSRSENVENFLFNTKRGVCYEYATSMVLLARAAGIPARYCEGYLMSDLENNSEYNTNYVITPKTAHGYPELYIKGAGWVQFEPTLYDGDEEKKEQSFFTTLMLAGLMLLGVLILVIVGILLYPSVYHKIFLSRCRKKEPNEAAKMIIFRLCRLYSISGVNTSHEAAYKIKEITGVDVYAAADYFDSVVYGDASLNDADREVCINCYISAYEALKEQKKKRRMIMRNKEGTYAGS